MDYSKLNGLIPAVIQDDESLEVLMVGFMNEDALARTRDDRLRHLLLAHAATRCGRRARRPAIGSPSISISTDCDDDTVLLRVRREGDGNVCHLGERRSLLSRRSRWSR